jgi:molecular chaperone GrpE
LAVYHKTSLNTIEKLKRNERLEFLLDSSYCSSEKERNLLMTNNSDSLPPEGNDNFKLTVEELEKQAECETQQLVGLETEVANLKDQWMRAMAETENLRRRAQRDREEALKYASANFGRDMLSIADNLRRALESCPTPEALPDTVKSLIQGIELTESSLLSTFDRYGIKKVEPLREKFDPNFHQAMFEIEDATVAPGTILQVLQPGYVMHDRLLRPAMVGVSKGGSQ